MTGSGPALNPLFLVVAEAALNAGGHDVSTPHHLAEIVPLVLPVLTTENLINRTSDLVAVAMDYTEARHNPASVSTAEDVNAASYRATEDGVYIGLVAGYLLARMLDGTDGAR